MANRLLTLIRACRDLRRTQLLDREAMLAVQERRWRDVMKRALAVSPFYRRRLAGLDPDRCALCDIPPLTKAEWLDNWDDIVADPRINRAALKEYLQHPSNWRRLFHGRWMVSQSSGTTGAPIIVPQPVETLDWMHAAHSVRNGATAQASVEPRPRIGRSRSRLVTIAFTRKPCASSAIYYTRPWVGSLFQSHHILNVEIPWPDLLKQLDRLQPNILVVFSSLLPRLAQAQIEGDLNLDFSRPGSSISTGGDLLTPGISELCRQAFGLEPLNGYGSAETMAIARKWCGIDRLLVYEDMVMLEAVDKDDRPVDEGALSHHVLATPLLNPDLPLLRYRLEDRIRMGPAQPEWPFRSIQEIHGRTAMTFHFRAPERRLLLGSSIAGSWHGNPRLVDYQLRQTGPAEIHFDFVPSPGESAEKLASEITAALRATLDQAGCRAARCAAQAVTALQPHPVSGKFERYVPLDA